MDRCLNCTKTEKPELPRETCEVDIAMNFRSKESVLKVRHNSQGSQFSAAVGLRRAPVPLGSSSICGTTTKVNTRSVCMFTSPNITSYQRPEAGP